MELDGTELSEAIGAVREGLARAQQDGAGPGIHFRVREVVLDLGIELHRTTSRGGGVKAFVVSGEARGERSSARTHRLTVTLDMDGDVTVGDRGELGDGPGERPFA
ncbi:trypco2 family protein [Streptomyces sp. NPDC055808]|uniref:trypco2 family protein n=1 Tax=Streptomyces sp. NPDC001828 TaxID=3364615 RepID=UPI003690DB4B